MNDTDKDKPEIILKEFMHSRGNTENDDLLHELGVMILANKAGYQWLSEFFGKLADKNWSTSDQPMDPDDHDHLDLWGSPINSQLSDSYEVRIGSLDNINRAAVFEKYDINPESAKIGDSTKRFQHIIDLVNNSSDGESFSSGTIE